MRNTSVFSCFLIASAGALFVVSTAEARPKRPVKMNSCSCACRQESETEVHISNKDFYSVASCGSYSGTSCNVTVSTSEGTSTVSGTWEGCVDHGKVWVLVREIGPQDLDTIIADPGDVLPKPPKRPREARPDEPPLTADPGTREPPTDDRTPAEPDQTLERSPD